MIDERHEELAALYAFDLLEGAEKSAFEASLARDAALRELVRELRESATSLAHTAKGVGPSPELKTRLLAEIGASPPRTVEAKRVAFPSWIAWAAAACFALIAAGTGQFYLTSRSEAETLRDQQALTEASLKSAQNLLEAERIIALQQQAMLNQQNTETSQQLADARSSLEEMNRRRAEADAAATNAQRLLAEATRRAEATENLLSTTRAELADIGRQLKLQGDVANLKITALVSRHPESGKTSRTRRRPHLSALGGGPAVRRSSRRRHVFRRPHHRRKPHCFQNETTHQGDRRLCDHAGTKRRRREIRGTVPPAGQRAGRTVAEKR
jgi:hypothetical protein